jgi:hypothetical protein
MAQIPNSEDKDIYAISVNSKSGPIKITESDKREAKGIWR